MGSCVGTDVVLHADFVDSVAGVSVNANPCDLACVQSFDNGQSAVNVSGEVQEAVVLFCDSQVSVLQLSLLVASAVQDLQGAAQLFCLCGSSGVVSCAVRSGVISVGQHQFVSAVVLLTTTSDQSQNQNQNQRDCKDLLHNIFSFKKFLSEHLWCLDRK